MKLYKVNCIKYSKSYVLTSKLSMGKKPQGEKQLNINKTVKAIALNTGRNQYFLFSNSVHGNGLRGEHVSLSEQGQLEFNVFKYPYQSL